MIRDNARLVLMDEAFRGLDREHRRKLSKGVRSHFKDATVLFVSHDVSDTQDFDRVLVVSEGRIVEDGDPRQLAAKADSHYRKLLDSEAEVRRSVWEAAAWRHLWIEDGRLHESQAADVVPDSSPTDAVAGPVVQVMLNGSADGVADAIDCSKDVDRRTEHRLQLPTEKNQ